MQQYWDVPAYQEMKALGMSGFTEEADRVAVLWFDLDLTETFAKWKGKLVMSWPPPERSWWRRAHRNELAVHAIHETSILAKAMPSWRQIILDWKQLALMPKEWRSALSQWRGVYLIHDRSDGKNYVGAAYGSDNILGRWANYAVSSHGGNRLLRQRPPEHFVFSILERVSPDMNADEIIALEQSWKARLHTAAPNGLNDN